VDQRGERVTDDSFLLAFNAHWEDIEMTLPPAEYGKEWAIVVDTAAGEVTTLTTAPGVIAAEPPTVTAAATHTVPARSLLVLQRTN
jgi:glycogen operon protein